MRKFALHFTVGAMLVALSGTAYAYITNPTFMTTTPHFRGLVVGTFPYFSTNPVHDNHDPTLLFPHSFLSDQSGVAMDGKGKMSINFHGNRTDFAIDNNSDTAALGIEGAYMGVRARNAANGNNSLYGKIGAVGHVTAHNGKYSSNSGGTPVIENAFGILGYLDTGNLTQATDEPPNLSPAPQGIGYGMYGIGDAGLKNLFIGGNLQTTSGNLYVEDDFEVIGNFGVSGTIIAENIIIDADNYRFESSIGEEEFGSDTPPSITWYDNSGDSLLRTYSVFGNVTHKPTAVRSYCPIEAARVACNAWVDGPTSGSTPTGLNLSPYRGVNPIIYHGAEGCEGYASKPTTNQTVRLHVEATCMMPYASPNMTP